MCAPISVVVLGVGETFAAQATVSAEILIDGIVVCLGGIFAFDAYHSLVEKLKAKF